MRLPAFVSVAAGLAVAVPASFVFPLDRAQALEPERYTVYCADEKIEISFWDLAQMKVRRGLDVCQFTSYTSYSDAVRFATKNFGGEDSPCVC